LLDRACDFVFESLPKRSDIVELAIAVAGQIPAPIFAVTRAYAARNPGQGRGYDPVLWKQRVVWAKHVWAIYSVSG
jgi:hypothetical protein